MRGYDEHNPRATSRIAVRIASRDREINTDSTAVVEE
jgi:hypothetical protein